MQLKIAELSDTEAVLELHSKYQIDSIQEDYKKDGFVTTSSSKEQLNNLSTRTAHPFISIKNLNLMTIVTIY